MAQADRSTWCSRNTSVAAVFDCDRRTANIQQIIFYLSVILYNTCGSYGQAMQEDVAINALIFELSWIGCLTSQLTIFQSYMWRHIDVQADWRRSWTYGRAPKTLLFWHLTGPFCCGKLKRFQCWNTLYILKVLSNIRQCNNLNCMHNNWIYQLTFTSGNARLLAAIIQDNLIVSHAWYRITKLLCS